MSFAKHASSLGYSAWNSLKVYLLIGQPLVSEGYPIPLGTCCQGIYTLPGLEQNRNVVKDHRPGSMACAHLPAMRSSSLLLSKTNTLYGCKVRSTARTGEASRLAKRKGSAMSS